MAARLPIPGSDDDTWGNVLNPYLEVVHNSDETLQASVIQQYTKIDYLNLKRKQKWDFLQK